MTIFDLLFIAVFFATILTLPFAAFAAVRGRGAQTFHIVKTLVIGLALYMSIVVLQFIFVAAPHGKCGRACLL